MSRDYTGKVADLMKDGIIDPTWLAEQLLNWLSEDDVREFALQELSDLVSDEDPEDNEPDVSEYQEWQDFDPEC